MNSAITRSAQIIANDRKWFYQHPEEAVRFRPMQTDEFKLLETNGVSPPEFRPSWCNSNTALEHVAVIDLTRLLQSDQRGEHLDRTIRIRIATIKARSKSVQANLESELVEAICKELLMLHNQAQKPTQTIRTFKPQNLAA